MPTLMCLYTNVLDLKQNRLIFIQLLNQALAGGCDEYAISLGHCPEYALPLMSLGLVQNKPCPLKNLKHS